MWLGPGKGRAQFLETSLSFLSWLGPEAKKVCGQEGLAGLWVDGWMVSGGGQLARFWGGKAGPSFLEGDTAEGVEQGLRRALATTQHHL